MDAHKLFKVLVMGALLSLGCDDRDEGDSEGTTKESGDGDGDGDPGDGDGEPETGDGDGEPGDGDGEPETGDGDPGDGDPGTGDGDGEPGTGDGDGDSEQCCPEECWIGPCECTGGVCCWLVPADHPGCEQQC
ncbi:MAG TPA: hypothetical protein VK034_31145 [Enhygromyxa sp.]|nr:hypothetical protein [Enhygromyxa sp.]